MANVIKFSDCCRKEDDVSSWGIITGPVTLDFKEYEDEDSGTDHLYGVSNEETGEVDEPVGKTPSKKGILLAEIQKM